MSISGNTKLLGLLGWPVAHSLSPAMHNAAAADLGLDLVYVPLPVAPQHLPTALQGLAALHFLGANVTVPHKEAVMPHLAAVQPAAQAIGAVNTITFAARHLADPSTAQHAAQGDNRQAPLPPLHGHNTDYSGFLSDLRDHDISIAARHCLVLGAGGSARAVVYALARGGAQVAVFARRPQQALRLVDELQPHVGAAALEAKPWQALQDVQAYSAPLIVNTTPVGMHPYETRSPWPDELPFPAGADLYDLIYNPTETRLMQQARAAGCRAVNGLGMLLHQGAQAFSLWTGMEPSLKVMAAALRRHGVG